MLAGLAFAAAPAAADPVSVSGTLIVEEDEGGEVFGVYIQTEDSEYLVSGPDSAELREHAGKTVTAKGTLMGSDFGERMIEVQQFTVVEE